MGGGVRWFGEGRLRKVSPRPFPRQQLAVFSRNGGGCQGFSLNSRKFFSEKIDFFSCDTGGICYLTYMSNELQLRIGQVIESKQGTFKVADIVEEQWYEPWVVLVKWNGNAWEDTSVKFQDL